MKLQRFIKEYASFQKNAISSNEFIKTELKEEAINGIDNILKARGRGLITVDETMYKIVNILTEISNN